MKQTNGEEPFNQTTTDPWLATLLLRRPSLHGRFLHFYQRLQQLPKRVQRQLTRRLALGLAGAALALALGRAPVSANSITVANGLVAVNSGDGQCSLIEAIHNANDTNNGRPHTNCAAGNPAGLDTINLPSGLLQVTTALGNYDGPTALPLITSKITITGNNTLIERVANSPDFRLLAVASSGDLTLNTVAVEDMRLSAGRGGAIDNQGTLTINHSFLGGNDAARGGAIASDGNLTINNSWVTFNDASSKGGGVYLYGGTALIVGSRLSSNHSFSHGGGVYSNYGDLTIVNSSVLQNFSGGYGGGVDSNEGLVTITNSTLSGNDASDGGGAVHAFYNAAAVTITNSTISGNAAHSYGSGGGGGVFSTYAPVTIVNSTITGNRAFDGGGVYVKGGDPDYDDSRLTLQRNLIAGNFSYFSTTGASGNEVASHSTQTVNTSHNLFGHSGINHVQAFDGFTPGATDITAVSNGNDPTPLTDILNTTLRDNAGLTAGFQIVQTHALVTGSPALDAAPSAACTASPVNGVDQRNQPRNRNGNGSSSSNECDIGAFETDDLDRDGIDNAVENGAPNNGDGNRDGTADRTQANVASLPNSEDGDYVTIAAPTGKPLTDVRATANPSPANTPPTAEFPIGFLDFRVENVPSAGKVVVKLFLPGAASVTSYWKYGPTPDNPTDHWYQFNYQSVTNTGAKFFSDRIELHFVDGQRGDGDLAANGVIVDPGAPASPPTSPTTVFVSPTAAGTTDDGLAFGIADILRQDPVTGNWSRYFNGAAAGFNKAIAAFTLKDDGSVLLTPTANITNLPGVGTVTPWDVVRFVPSTGNYHWYIDGSDVGLMAAAEKIDALEVLANGKVLISTTGILAVPKPGGGTLKSQDEDLTAFTFTGAPGSTTTGTWALYFNGTAVAGMSAEDITGAAVDPTTGDIYLSLQNGFNLGGVTGGPKDILILRPSGGGNYTPERFWRGPEHGFDRNLGGIEISN